LIGGRTSEFRSRAYAEIVNDLGKTLVLLGLILVAVGALLWSGYGRGWLGRLPGDIHYHRGNFSFYFPLVTCLLVSIFLTLLLWIFRR
jgi:membrane protein implicated in regulation of membrane protease activity